MSISHHPTQWPRRLYSWAIILPLILLISSSAQAGQWNWKQSVKEVKNKISKVESAVAQKVESVKDAIDGRRKEIRQVVAGLFGGATSKGSAGSCMTEKLENLSPYISQASDLAFLGSELAKYTLESEGKIYTYQPKAADGGKGHLTIYYTTSGKHQVKGWDQDNGGTLALPSATYSDCNLVDGSGPSSYSSSNAPDYVEKLGCYLEYSLAVFSDYGFNNGKIPEKVGKVFVINYGDVAAGGSLPWNIPLLGGSIFMDYDLNDGWLKTTSAHEIFHQYQYSYVGNLRSRWMLEGTAKWAEDLVFDDLNAYASSIDNYLKTPEKDLRTASYSAAIFWRYLTEHYGEIDDASGLSVDLMQRLWRQWTSQPGVAGINSVLKAIGANVTFDQVFADQFAYANYLKQWNIDDEAYEYAEDEEASYDEVAVANDDKALLSVDAPLTYSNESVEAYGVRYYRVVPETDVTQIHITIDGADDFVSPRYRIAAIYDNGASVDLQQSSSTNYDVDIPNDESLSEIVIAVAAVGQPGTYSLLVEVE